MKKIIFILVLMTFKAYAQTHALTPQQIQNELQTSNKMIHEAVEHPIHGSGSENILCYNVMNPDSSAFGATVEEATAIAMQRYYRNRCWELSLYRTIGQDKAHAYFLPAGASVQDVRTYLSGESERLQQIQNSHACQNDYEIVAVGYMADTIALTGVNELLTCAVPNDPIFARKTFHSN